MSYYNDGRYRVKRDRYSRPGGGVVDETYVDSRGGYGSQLVRRRDDSEDSVVEEVTRDFPPGESYGYQRPRRVTTVREGVRRARSAGGRDPYYDEDYYRRDEYRPSRPKRYDDRRDRYARRSSYSSSRSPSPRPRRRKSLGEQAMGAIGGVLGVKALQNRSRSRSRDRGDRGRARSRHRSYSDSRSRSRGGRGGRAKSEARIAQAVKAALTAGAAEAFRSRNAPGSWKGDKGKRILTAAISAGGVDGLIDKDPNKHGGRHVVESVLAGLATSHLVNGSRSKSRGRDGSQSRGGIKDIAATGILAAAGKQVFDRVRSKSRGRSRSDSRDSYDGDRRQGDSKKRGSSVSRALGKGLAALGLDDKKKDDRRGARSSRYSDDSEYSSDDNYRSSRRRGRSNRDVRSQGGSANRSISTSGANHGVSTSRAGGGGGGGSDNHSSDSDSDLGDSDREKRERKKMRRTQLVTAGLATVATVHAAHSVMKGVEGRKKRRQALKEGKISEEQARKARMQANFKDAGSVGLAVLGIKGAVSEWKEVQEKRKEQHEYEEQCRERHQKRILRRNQSVNGSSSTGSRRGDWDHGSTPHYTDGNPYGHSYAIDY